MTVRPRLSPLAKCIVIAFSLATLSSYAADIHVINCADDGPGSLRNAVADALTGENVILDAATISCSPITLTTGEVSTAVADITLIGPVDSEVTVDAGGHSRVFKHTGTGTLQISNLRLSHGYVYAPVQRDGGACILSKGSVELVGVTIDSCTVQSGGPDEFGGGLFVQQNLTMQSSQIMNSYDIPYFFSPTQQSQSGGGGAWVYGSASLQDSTLSGNSAGGGGGLYVGHDLILSRSAIQQNDAGVGGGIMVGYRATSVTIADSTISENNSSQYCAVALGVFATSVQEVATRVTNSTIAFNNSNGLKAQQGSNGEYYAAGLCTTGALTIQSTIVSNNIGGQSTPADFSMTTGTATVVGSHNLIRTTVNGTIPPLGTLTTDPLLAPLANNGGVTMTHALMSGSPAIDTGCATTDVAFDQRGVGFPRLWGLGVDIGAFESGSPPTGDVIFRNGLEATTCGP